MTNQDEKKQKNVTPKQHIPNILGTEFYYKYMYMYYYGQHNNCKMSYIKYHCAIIPLCNLVVNVLSKKSWTLYIICLIFVQRICHIHMYNISYSDMPKVFGHCDFLLYISCKTTFLKNIIPKSTLVRFWWFFYQQKQN